MNNKVIIAVVIIIIVLGGAYWYVASLPAVAPRDVAVEQTQDTNQSQNNDRVAMPTDTEKPSTDTTDTKLKAANFTGKLEKVDTGCFVDGECYVVVDGKYITTTMGWSRETVGSVQGVESFGDLEKHIGEQIEAYVHDKGDGTYTLYGSEGFYIKLK